MALGVHPLVQDADDQNVVIVKAVEDDVFLVVMRPEGWAESHAFAPGVRVGGEEFKAFLEGAIILLGLGQPKLSERVVENLVYVAPGLG